MTRVAGRLLMAIAVIHALFGLWRYFDLWVDVARDGFWDAVDGHLARGEAFWFLLASPMLWTLGQFISWAGTRGVPLPAWLSWELLIVSAVGIVLMPISGFWLLLAPSLLLLVETHREQGASAVSLP